MIWLKGKRGFEDKNAPVHMPNTVMYLSNIKTAFDQKSLVTQNLTYFSTLSRSFLCSKLSSLIDKATMSRKKKNCVLVNIERPASLM